MKALIVVDVQNDFCPGGSLAVEDGDRIIPTINKLMNSDHFDQVIATQDWHPEGHISFASTYDVEPFQFHEYAGQIVWPDHCIKGTLGADFRPSLDQRPIDKIVRKGSTLTVDSYSAFCDNNKEFCTGVARMLEDYGNEIYVCGIATDVCVLNTVMDGLKHGGVFFIKDASAGVTPEGVDKAIEEMKLFGVHIIESTDIL